MKGKGLLFFRKAGGQYLLDGSTLDEAISKLPTATRLKTILSYNAAYYPTQRLPIRVTLMRCNLYVLVTYLDGDGMAHILFARFQVYSTGNNVDNFADGQTGNLIADVDLDSGRIKKTLQKWWGNLACRY